MPLLKKLEQLNSIGVALSAERDNIKLLEMILLGAKEITGADGGTLYTLTEDKRLNFEIVSNSSLNIALGGTSERKVPFLPIPLFNDDNSPNLSAVSAYAALTSTVVNIENSHVNDQFDFTGMREFDRHAGYDSQSVLTIPMLNHEAEVIGVLQLINAIGADGQVIPFSEFSQNLVKSLASQAAVALTNHNLIKGMNSLFEAFVTLIAEAIDQKSPYTGGHCRRVPELTMLLAQAAIDAKSGPLQDFTLNEAEFYELKIAGWLHDCGKAITPDSVMDKATKLSTIFDRINLIDTRFELLKSQATVAHLNRKLEALENGETANLAQMDAELSAFKNQCDDDREFLRKSNFGGENMTEEDQQRIRNIAAITIVNEHGELVGFLNEDEVYNLSIARGTLTKEEREVINNHINVTISMLESLPYPKCLQRIPEYAGAHHERMDGKGYPNGLTREQMSIPARMMGIADIFEALTSKDRPYKKAKTLSESLFILGNMKLNNHIDPDLFDLFVSEKVYLKYATQFLEPEQIDDVDESKIPGFVRSDSKMSTLSTPLI